MQCFPDIKPLIRKIKPPKPLIRKIIILVIDLVSFGHNNYFYLFHKNSFITHFKVKIISSLPGFVIPHVHYVEVFRLSLCKNTKPGRSKMVNLLC